MDNNIIFIQPTSAVKKYQRKYKCPYCNNKYERKKLPVHIQNVHEDMIPEGYTALRVAFNTINNKTEGHCIICGDVTEWNESKGRYERLCGRQSCLDTYKKMVQERTKKKYGTDRLQSDPRYAEEVQKKALAGRKISGEYKFQDGGVIKYVGSYEKKFLEFVDKIMHIESTDIESPGPSIEYEWNGKIHIYLPDFLYIPYNLLIEIKDGGDNPNKNPEMQQYKIERQHAKEDAVKNKTSFNYIRLTNNDFGQLMTAMSVLKYNMNDENITDTRFFRVNENMVGVIGSAIPPNNQFTKSNHDCYIINYSRLGNVFDSVYGITKDPTMGIEYIVDESGNVSLKNIKDSDKYTVFKIKDPEVANELYQEIKDCYTKNKKVSTKNLEDIELESVLKFSDSLKLLENDMYDYLKGQSNTVLEMCNKLNSIESIFMEA